MLAGTGANCDERSDLSDAARRGRRRGRFAPGRAVLQQAVAGGLVPAFPRHRARDRLPIVLYSIPSRCGVEIGVETVRRLAAECKNIIGIKEAGGSCDRVSQLRAALGPKFEILSGDDSLTLPFMAVGAQGVISVASNVIPREVAQMVNAFAARQRAQGRAAAREIHPAVQGFVHRDEPGPRQGRAGDDGCDRGGISSAAGADERGEPREIARDDEGVRTFVMTNEDGRRKMWKPICESANSQLL